MSDDAFGIWDEPSEQVAAEAGPSSNGSVATPGAVSSKGASHAGVFGSSLDDEPGWGAADEAAVAANAATSAAPEGLKEEPGSKETQAKRDSAAAAAAGASGGFDDTFDDDDDDGDGGGNGFKEAVEEQDDDFGDFGDFDESQAQDISFGFDDDEEEAAAAAAAAAAEGQKQVEAAGASGSGSGLGSGPGPSEPDWRPLELSRDSSSLTAAALAGPIRQLLSEYLEGSSSKEPFPFHDGPAAHLGDDQVRQVPGLAQVLVREESRKLWTSLTAEPSLKPLDWMRSRTRRQHLISLGVPINLDEVRPSEFGASKALPPLSLSMDAPMSKSGVGAGPGAGAGAGIGAGVGAGSGTGTGAAAAARAGNGSAGATPDVRSPTARNAAQRRKEDKLGLGPAPEVDMARAKALIALTEDQLTLQPLPSLRTMARELEQLTRSTSALLTHHLALREAHGADAEMYNGLIKDLVTGAANRISGSSGGASAAAAAGGIQRRSTPSQQLRRGASGPGPRSSMAPGSGRSSPAPGRSGSPRIG